MKKLFNDNAVAAIGYGLTIGIGILQIAKAFTVAGTERYEKAKMYREFEDRYGLEPKVTVVTEGEAE